MFVWIGQNWKNVPVAALALLMVAAFAPMAVASFGFSEDDDNWDDSGSNAGLFTFLQNDNKLELTYIGSVGSAVSGTYTITATGITADGGETLGGNLAAAFGPNLTSGNVKIEVAVTGFDPGHENGDGFLLPENNYPSGSMFLDHVILQQSISITITIKFQSALFASQPSTPMMTFTFSEIQ